MAGSHVVFIGGRSGAGKSTVAFALHDLLSGHNVQHAVIEGDALDLAHPAPWQHRLAERNLAAIWANYQDLGYRRLIYTNTVSVLHTSALTAAMGDDPEVTAVLLRSSDRTAAERLGQRERGASLEMHLDRSRARATHLDEHASDAVHRLDTDGQRPAQIAERIVHLAGWLVQR